MAKNWLITGTSSGFGRALLELVLESGGAAAATVRDPAVLTELQARHGERLRTYQLDVTRTSAVREVMARAFADIGRIDVVVSNAGYALLGAAEELSDAEIERQIATNLTGSIHVLRAAVPHLRAQGGGRLIQLASMGAHMAYPALGLYHATKWGIEGFCEALAQEVAPFGIGVTMIEPGAANTKFASVSASIAQPLDVYEATPVGGLRAAAAAGVVPMPVDPAKVARAIVQAAAENPAPLRVALGSDAYAAIGDALRRRLQSLEDQKSVALAADITA